MDSRGTVVKNERTQLLDTGLTVSAECEIEERDGGQVHVDIAIGIEEERSSHDVRHFVLIDKVLDVYGDVKDGERLFREAKQHAREILTRMAEALQEKTIERKGRGISREDTAYWFSDEYRSDNWDSDTSGKLTRVPPSWRRYEDSPYFEREVHTYYCGNCGGTYDGLPESESTGVCDGGIIGRCRRETNSDGTMKETGYRATPLEKTVNKDVQEDMQSAENINPFSMMKSKISDCENENKHTEDTTPTVDADELRVSEVHAIARLEQVRLRDVAYMGSMQPILNEHDMDDAMYFLNWDSIERNNAWNELYDDLEKLWDAHMCREIYFSDVIAVAHLLTHQHMNPRDMAPLYPYELPTWENLEKNVNFLLEKDARFYRKLGYMFNIFAHDKDREGK